MRDELYVGLISGTSADAIDAALIAFGPTPHLLAARSTPYPADLQATILRVSQSDAAIDLDGFGELDACIGECFATATLELLRAAGVATDHVRAIGSHGQTLRHRPHGPAPFTLQLGDPHRIAERTGITTVCDFRRRDVAAGGQGAPLVPAFHAGVFARPDRDRAILNLGGIANLSLLPRQGPVLGFDTGPANGLMDAWCKQHRQQPFDAEGAWAASGSPDPNLLAALMSDPYFRLPPPKSTGRDHFHLAWLASHLGASPPAAADVQATLLELTARSVADALRRWQAQTAEVLACGGGVRNVALMHALERHLAPARLATTASEGLDPDFVEAAAFAWLARETLAGRPGNLPSVTGAAGPRVLGAIVPA